MSTRGRKSRSAVLVRLGACGLLGFGCKELPLRRCYLPSLETHQALHFEADQVRRTIRITAEGAVVLFDYDASLSLVPLSVPATGTALDGGAPEATRIPPDDDQGRTIVQQSAGRRQAWIVCGEGSFEPAGDAGTETPVVPAGADCEYELVREAADAEWDTDLSLTSVIDTCDYGGTYSVHVEVLEP